MVRKSVESDGGLANDDEDEGANPIFRSIITLAYTLPPDLKIAVAAELVEQSAKVAVNGDDADGTLKQSLRKCVAIISKTVDSLPA